MMRLTLGARDRRALLLCATAVGGILLAGRGLPAWRRWDADVRHRAASAASELRTLEAGIELLPAMRDSLAAQRRRLDSLRAMLIPGTTPAEAASLLAGTARELATDAGVQLNAVQVRADTGFRASVARIAVRLSATGDVAGLAELLRALEGHDLLLHVRELSVSQSAPASPDNVPETLRFDLLVEGLAMDARGGPR